MSELYNDANQNVETKNEESEEEERNDSPLPPNETHHEKEHDHATIQNLTGIFKINDLTNSTNSITQSTLLVSQSEHLNPMNESCDDLGPDLKSLQESNLASQLEEQSSSIELNKPSMEKSCVDLVADLPNLNSHTELMQNSCVDLGQDLKSLEQTTSNSINQLKTFMNESCVDLGVSEVENKPEQEEEKTLETQNLQTHSELSNKSQNETSFHETNSPKIPQEALEEINNEIKESLVEKQNEDVESLVNDYEIPNFQTQQNDLEHENETFTNLNKSDCENKEESNENKEDLIKQEKKTNSASVIPKKNLDDEVFEKPLGSDSLLKKIIQYGDETETNETRPHNGQMCTISYFAMIKDTQTTVEKYDDFSFILGDADVTPAIDLIVSLMYKNEKCQVIAEARHAYGALGKKPDIPENASLFYEIHLKDFKNLTDLNSMEPVERLSLAEAKKLRGNFHFNRQDFSLAIYSYKKGLKYFNEENLTGNEESNDIEKFLELRQALLMNLALSNFKLGEYREALDSLNQVLKAQNKHMKALYIKGKVLMHLGETKEAIECLSKSLELDKNNLEVKKELMKAQAKHKQQYESEKKMYKKMISGVGELQKNEAYKKTLKQAEKKDSSNFVSYAAAGFVIAAASIGIAVFAKYKNLI